MKSGCRCSASRIDGTQFLRHGVLLRNLQVVLRAGRLVARSHTPVDPVGGVEPLPCGDNLFGREHVGNVKQHR